MRGLAPSATPRSSHDQKITLHQSVWSAFCVQCPWAIGRMNLETGQCALIATIDAGGGCSGSLSQYRGLNIVCQALYGLAYAMATSVPARTSRVSDNTVLKEAQGHAGFHAFNGQVHGIAHVYAMPADA